MTFPRSLAALTAAAALAAVPAFASPATAAERTPADVAANAAPATISTEVAPLVNGDPKWRPVVAERAKQEPRLQEVVAHSPSMDRDVPMVLIRAAEPGRPTLYLLNGAGGGEQSGTDWVSRTNAVDFYLSKNVNVVIPMAGKFSYYTDWVEDNPNLGGKQTWETFLTKELPGPLEQFLGANNNRAIAGMSMSATSALLLAQHNPGFYDSVGAFSGCASTADPASNAFIRITVNRGKATPEQMWGPVGGELNRHNDALLNAEGLRGSEVYLSNGSGLIGTEDTMTGLQELRGYSEGTALEGAAKLAVEGGVIEGATNVCTHALASKLKTLNIPADVEFRNTGVHTWTYWEKDLEDSWPTIARGLGI